MIAKKEEIAGQVRVQKLNERLVAIVTVVLSIKQIDKGQISSVKK